MLKIPSKISKSRSRGRWLPKLTDDFLLQRHISGKIFTKIRLVLVVIREVANSQTNKQTDRQTRQDRQTPSKNTLFGGGNDWSLQ